MEQLKEKMNKSFEDEKQFKSCRGKIIGKTGVLLEDLMEEIMDEELEDLLKAIRRINAKSGKGRCSGCFR